MTAAGDEKGAPLQPQVSVVIPVGDKVLDLGEVLVRYREEMDKRGCAAEFVVVLDGVSDEAFRVAQRARPPGANVRLVRLNHPFGESIALSAGFRITSGQVVITLPPYLQIEPADIHRVLNAIDDGLDVVAGHRLRRVDPIINRIQSRIFNGIMRMLTGVPLHDMNCPVRAMRRKVLEDVTVTGEMVRFLPILAHRHGFRVGEAKVRHLRERGRSGFFGVGVYVRRFLDVINLLFLSKFTRAPLRFFGVAGILCVLLGAAICLWLTADFFFFAGESLRNRPLLLVGVMLIVLGVQTFSIGLVGEIIIFTQAKNLKEYRLFEEAEEMLRTPRANNARRVRGGAREGAEAEAPDAGGALAGAGEPPDPPSRHELPVRKVEN
ncbi:MAG: glycosyltransferase [Planctomycetes bacterium]|nr:glycosyltransferase [Planctomycetota bacterium]